VRYEQSPQKELSIEHVTKWHNQMADEINAWLPIRMKKPAMGAAVDWRIKLLGADYIWWAHVATGM